MAEEYESKAHCPGNYHCLDSHHCFVNLRQFQMSLGWSPTEVWMHHLSYSIMFVLPIIPSPFLRMLCS